MTKNQNINAQLTYLNRDIDTLKKVKQVLNGLYIAEVPGIQVHINATIVELEEELDLIRTKILKHNGNQTH